MAPAELARSRSPRRRTRYLRFLLSAMLAAAAAGCAVSPGLPLPASHAAAPSSGPPLAEVATSPAAGSSIEWVRASPLKYAWYRPVLGRSPVEGPFTREWVHLESWQASGRTVLYARGANVPNLLAILRYRSLGGTGMPAGTPEPASCGASSGCSVRSCSLSEVRGMCVVLDNAAFQPDPVIVVFAQWLVPGVPLSEIRKDGPATDSVSWGVVADRQPPRASR